MLQLLLQLRFLFQIIFSTLKIALFYPGTTPIIISTPTTTFAATTTSTPITAFTPTITSTPISTSPPTSPPTSTPTFAPTPNYIFSF